jgi:hypothetical protein
MSLEGQIQNLSVEMEGLKVVLVVVLAEDLVEGLVVLEEE